jgi:hypothetical protein
VSAIGRALSFATQLYRLRAGTIYAGYLRNDPMARLQLRPGRDDPYAIYERMRAAGPLVPTRLGNWATTSHQVWQRRVARTDGSACARWVARKERRDAEYEATTSLPVR